jgi:hypothetical protein
VSFADWLIGRVTRRPPDFIIGTAEEPYMHRWWVIPRNRFFNIYLHNIKRDDADYALHDHPWMNLSIVLKGGYYEVTPLWRPSVRAPQPLTHTAWKRPGSWTLRRPTSAHRLMVESSNGPTWSLFITGPVMRSWGFWCKRGWLPYKDVVELADKRSEMREC